MGNADFTPTRIAADREIINAATPGPWNSHDKADYAEIHNGDTWGKALSPIALVGCDEDAAFIAAARTGWPEAMDEVERLQRNENTILLDERRFTDGGVRGLLERIEYCNQVCLEHQQERMNLQADIARLKEAQQWIAVEDGLPKTNKPVQVYMPKLHMSVQTGFYDRYYGEDDSEWYEHWVAPSEVTHWRELPAAPEAPEEGDSRDRT